MKKKLEIGLCYLTACLSSIIIMIYGFKEKELIRFCFGYMLIALCIFLFLMWLLKWAEVRDIRKTKKKKTIDEMSLE